MIRRSERTKKTKENYTPNEKKKVNKTKHKQSKQVQYLVVGCAHVRRTDVSFLYSTNILILSTTGYQKLLFS